MGLAGHHQYAGEPCVYRSVLTSSQLVVVIVSTGHCHRGRRDYTLLTSVAAIRFATIATSLVACIVVGCTIDASKSNRYLIVIYLLFQC